MIKAMIPFHLLKITNPSCISHTTWRLTENLQICVSLIIARIRKPTFTVLPHWNAMLQK